MTFRRRGAACSTMPAAVKTSNEREARAVAAGHFRLIDPEFAVVDLQAGKGRHDVLDHLDGGLAAAKRRSPRRFKTVLDGGGNSRTSLQVGPHENDARLRRRGAKLDADIASAPVSHSLDRRRGGYRSLVSCCLHSEAPVIHDELKRKFSPTVRPSLAGGGRRAASVTCDCRRRGSAAARCADRPCRDSPPDGSRPAE